LSPVVYVALAIRSLVVVVFGVSAFGKLRSRAAFATFRSWVASVPVWVAPRRPDLVAATLAGAEAVIVVLVALPWTATAGLALALVTLAVFTAGTWIAVARGTDAPCQCFGASAAPLGPRHVLRDALLCVLAAAGVAVAGAGGARPAGVLMSLAVGLAVALFVVHLDDLAALFTRDGIGQPGH
jgi:hypothetical protein